MKDEIYREIDRLMNQIKNTTIYKHYVELDLKLSREPTIILLVEEIKQLNKDLVNAEHQKRIKDIEMLEYELEAKTKRLNQLSLYQEYIRACMELSKMIERLNRQMDHFVNGE